MSAWGASGAGVVQVNYTDPYGCTDTIATVDSVIVNPLPIQTITGQSSACIGSTGKYIILNRE